MEKSLLTSLVVVTLFVGTVSAAPSDGHTAVGSAQSVDVGAIASPMTVVQESNREINDALGTRETIDEETRARVFALMDEVTDFDKMSLAAIESFCDDQPEETCAEWSQVFTDLLRVQALRKVGRYRADRFEYLEEEIDGDRAKVYTLAYFEDDDATIDYELEFNGDEWLIVNYVVDDVDTVRSYRKQFTRLLGRETVDQLIDRLRRQKDKLESEQSEGEQSESEQ